MQFQILKQAFLILSCWSLYVFGQGAFPIDTNSPNWKNLPYPEGVSSNAFLAKSTSIIFPARFSLSDPNISFSPTHSANQSGYGTCWAHAIIHALEIETKKMLLIPLSQNGYGLPYSSFNINLSERQLVCLYKSSLKEAYVAAGDSTTNPMPEIDGASLTEVILATRNSIIPLEGDNCYSPHGNAAHPGENGDISPPSNPFNAPINALYGVSLPGCAQICNEENELAIKYVLMYQERGVMVNIYLPSPDPNYLESESSTDINHSVCIIGWNDTAKVADYVNGAWVQKGLGKAWIVQNWHGHAHYSVATGQSEPWFYLKMGKKIANAGPFFCLYSSAKINDVTQFVNRLFKADHLDCNGDALSATGWCGAAATNNQQAGLASYFSSSLVSQGLDITLNDMILPNGTPLAPGAYIVDKYRIEFDIRYFGCCIAPYNAYTVGASNDNTLATSSWSNIYSVQQNQYMTSTAKAETYVYFIKGNTQRAINQWYPCMPNQAKVGYIFTPDQNVANCPNPYGPTAINLNKTRRIQHQNTSFSKNEFPK
jgi:hypothetical protein